MNDRHGIPDLVLLGGDIGVYAIARAFHEEYGTISTVVSRSVAGPIADSAILRNEPVGDDATTDMLLQRVREVGARYAKEGRRPILLANADFLVHLMSDNREELQQWFHLPILDPQVLRTVSDKARFIETCTALDIPTPDTVIVDFSQTGKVPELPTLHFDFPVVAKPASSSAYAEVKFSGKKKVYFLNSPAEIQELIDSLSQAGFSDKFLIQETIGGDDTAMRSITAYVDSHGEVTLLGGARVLLEEHTPGALGNPAAMITSDLGPLFSDAERFLKETGYRGFANFDIKVDPRSGKAVFFEVNPRIGRNNYYMTGAGANIARPVIADIRGEKLTSQLRPYGPILYTIVPGFFLKRYLREPGLRRAVKLAARHKTVHPLDYSSTEGVKRKAYVLISGINQIKKFLTHYPRPSAHGF